MRARLAAIGEWVADQSSEVLGALGVAAMGTLGRPMESTLRRAFVRLDADLLDQLIGAFMWTRTAVVGGRRVIAIDGKTVRGARTANATAPHLVAVFDHVARTVLRQLAVSAKSNEIRRARPPRVFLVFARLLEHLGGKLSIRWLYGDWCREGSFEVFCSEDGQETESFARR